MRDKYECPFVSWEETDYDVISGHSHYEPVCTQDGTMKARCYRYGSKYCKVRLQTGEEPELKTEEGA